LRTTTITITIITTTPGRNCHLARDLISGKLAIQSKREASRGVVYFARRRVSPFASPLHKIPFSFGI
jgi:hypothetical protein